MALAQAVDGVESSVDESGCKCLFVFRQKKARKIVQRVCLWKRLIKE
jgi:hypothetical protein